MISISDLTLQNPWWVYGTDISDPKLDEYNNSKFKWTPRIKNKIHLDQEGIYVIRGPRRIGKSTLLRLMIKEALDKGVDPKNIFFWSCDNVTDRKELYDILRTYLEWSDSKEHKLLFIDEVTFVEDWELAYKAIFEEFGLSNKTFIFTGSSSHDLKKGTEKLPGRKGKTGRSQIIFMPMKFSEYISLADRGLYENLVKVWSIKGEYKSNLSYPTQQLHELLLNSKKRKELVKLISSMLPFKNQLDRHLNDFFLSGGIIKPINELKANGSIQNYTYEMYIEWVLGDIAGFKLSNKTAKNLIRSLINNLSNSIGWRAICSSSGIVEEKTAMEYSDMFNSIFLINYLDKLDLNRFGPALRSNKKFYFTSSFFYMAFKAYLQNPAANYFIESKKMLDDTEIKSKLIEQVVCDHLIRLAYSTFPSDIFDPKDLLFYSGSNKEIDFVLKNQGSFAAFEVKYQNSINSGDYRELDKFKGLKYLISKNEFLENKTITIPVSIFLMLI
jgi:hypothetical protein